MEGTLKCECEHASHIPTNGCQEEGRHYAETRYGVFYICTNCLEEHLWHYLPNDPGVTEQEVGQS